MPTKKELRNAIRLKKKSFTEEELRVMSCPIAEKVLNLPQVASAETVMLYCSLPDEVDTSHIIRRLKAEGKRILLPAVVSDTEMELRHYETESDLQKGKYDIMEPVGKPFCNVEEIDVMIIPGMGFDRQGNRLGRGKGYYDRFLLSNCSSAFKVGVCFPFQLIDEIPTDKYDVRMDTIVSE